MCDHTGETRKNTYGYLMTIEKYISDIDLWVKFRDGYKVHTNYQRFKQGMVRNPNNRTICGVGYMGEGQYNSKDDEKIYNIWVCMIRRCYDKIDQKKHPSYNGVKVSKEFLCFQNFAEWYYQNHWQYENEKMHIDKDLLQWEKDNKDKIYSPDTVVIIPETLNKIIECKSHINVEHYYRKYRVQFRGKKYSFDSEQEAIEAYRKMKEKYINELGEMLKDKLPERVYNGIVNWRMAA